MDVDTLAAPSLPDGGAGPEAGADPGTPAGLPPTIEQSAEAPMAAEEATVPTPEERIAQLDQQVKSERNRANSYEGRARKLSQVEKQLADALSIIDQFKGQLATVQQQQQQAQLQTTEHERTSALLQSWATRQGIDRDSAYYSEFVQQWEPEARERIRSDLRAELLERERQSLEQTRREAVRIASAPAEMAAFLTERLTMFNNTPTAKRLGVTLNEATVRTVLEAIRPGRQPHELTPADVLEAIGLAQQQQWEQGGRAARTQQLAERAASGVDSLDVTGTPSLSWRQIRKAWAGGNPNVTKEMYLRAREQARAEGVFY